MESCRHEMKVGSYIVARDFGEDGRHGLPKTVYSIRSPAICEHGSTLQLSLGVALMMSYTRRIELFCGRSESDLAAELHLTIWYER